MKRRAHCADRTAGHGHAIAARPCLLRINTLSRAVLKLTTEINHASRKQSNGLLPFVLHGRWVGGLTSLGVLHTVLVTFRCPCTRIPPSNSI